MKNCVLFYQNPRLISIILSGLPALFLIRPLPCSERPDCKYYVYKKLWLRAEKYCNFSTARVLWVLQVTIVDKTSNNMLRDFFSSVYFCFFSFFFGRFCLSFCWENLDCSKNKTSILLFVSSTLALRFSLHFLLLVFILLFIAKLYLSTLDFNMMVNILVIYLWKPKKLKIPLFRMYLKA